MKTFLATLAAAAISSVAFGDELTLRNGSTFTGSVREEGDRVTIETEFGFMTFKKIDVRSVVKGRDVVREFADRLQTATSVPELLKLAAWAREQELNTRAVVGGSGDGLRARAVAKVDGVGEPRRRVAAVRVGRRERI